MFTSFKSDGKSDFYSLNNKILVNLMKQVQTELRFQRHEHKQIISILNRLLNDANLQKQVDTFYTEDTQSEDIGSDNPNP